MDCEKRNILDPTNPDKKKCFDLEEILHNQDQESLYMEIMLSSYEAISNIQQDLEAGI